MTNISKIIEACDYILWVSDQNKYKNDSYEIYLWAKNTSFKNTAENSLIKSISNYIKLENSLKTINYYENKEITIEILNENIYKSLEKIFLD